ncbi:MAG TPA: hypothetical protein VM103_02840 [Candidatus Paceibacterota bacterium]|nr:hypothetical protein [Candidatus Paceibacterota bacterium]
MAREVLFAWEGKEYEHEPKTADWYWAVGILATAGVIASILFSNVLLALLILVATGAIALRAAKHPPTHSFELTHDGLIIGNDLHPFERMTSFSVLEDIEGKFPPVLSIKTESLFAPHLVIPLDGVDADGIYALFLDRVDEGEHHHTLPDLVAAWLGF